jgi:hypothetical protein
VDCGNPHSTVHNHHSTLRNPSLHNPHSAIRNRFDRQCVADLRSLHTWMVGAELDGRKRAPRDRDPVALESERAFDDDPAPIEEEHVDRETHAEHMNGVAGCQDQRGIDWKGVASEQPPLASGRIQRGLDGGREHDALARVDQTCGRVRVEKRNEEMIGHCADR